MPDGALGALGAMNVNKAVGDKSLYKVEVWLSFDEGFIIPKDKEKVSKKQYRKLRQDFVEGRLGMLIEEKQGLAGAAKAGTHAFNVMSRKGKTFINMTARDEDEVMYTKYYEDGFLVINFD